METIQDTLRKVIAKMEVVETFSKLTGEEKKMRVMSSLKCFMSDYELDKYYDFIDGFVDLMCEIARGSDTIRVNDIKKKFLSCCR